jgi:hypothetical protein
LLEAQNLLKDECWEVLAPGVRVQEVTASGWLQMPMLVVYIPHTVCHSCFSLDVNQVLQQASNKVKGSYGCCSWALAVERLARGESAQQRRQVQQQVGAAWSSDWRSLVV